MLQQDEAGRQTRRGEALQLTPVPSCTSLLHAVPESCWGHTRLPEGEHHPGVCAQEPAGGTGALGTPVLTRATCVTIPVAFLRDNGGACEQWPGEGASSQDSQVHRLAGRKPHEEAFAFISSAASGDLQGDRVRLDRPQGPSWSPSAQARAVAQTACRGREARARPCRRVLPSPPSARANGHPTPGSSLTGPGRAPRRARTQLYAAVSQRAWRTTEQPCTGAAPVHVTN